MSPPRDRSAFCSKMGGEHDEASQTCVFEAQVKEEESMVPKCQQECAKLVFSEGETSCYSFEKLANGVYRQKYIMNDACWPQTNMFLSTCVDRSSNGICSSASSWDTEHGTFIPQVHKTVYYDGEADPPTQCKQHRSMSSCRAAVCDWHERKPVVSKPAHQTHDEFRLACSESEGVFDEKEGECVLPNCVKMQNPLSGSLPSCMSALYS